MMINSIAFIVYPVSNMARARHFYEGSLGLKPGNIFENTWCEYDVGSGTFAVATIEMGHEPGAKGAVVGFEVDDLDAFVAFLKKKGVPFVMDVMATSVCRMAVIEDPDRNHVTIHRKNQPEEK